MQVNHLITVMSKRLIGTTTYVRIALEYDYHDKHVLRFDTRVHSTIYFKQFLKNPPLSTFKCVVIAKPAKVLMSEI